MTVMTARRLSVCVCVCVWGGLVRWFVYILIFLDPLVC